MKVDVKEYIDSLSGNRVLQWTNSKYKDQHLYFTSPSVTDDNQYLIILSERNGRPNLYSIDRKSFEMEQITDSKGLLRSYTYPKGNLQGLSKASPYLDSKRKVIYWIEDDAVYCKSLVKNRKPDKITTLPENWVTGYTHVSGDGKKLCVPCTDPRAFSDNDYNQKDQLKNVPKRMINNGYKSKVIIIDIETGTSDSVIEIPFWVTHVQFHPEDFSKVLCNSEGRTVKNGSKSPINPNIRMWIVKNDNSFYPLHNQKGERSVNHENWFDNDNAVIYHGKFEQNIFKKSFYYILLAFNKYLKNISKKVLEKQFDHFVAVRNDVGNLILKHKTNHPVSHATAGTKAYNFLTDSRDGNIYAYRLNNDILDKSVICQHSSSMLYQDAHPHPKTCKDGESVIFTSDKGGICNVYEVKLGYAL